MRAVRAKKLNEIARKRSLKGSVIRDKEYHRLKDEYKEHSQTVKTKMTKRERRRKDISVLRSDVDIKKERLNKFPVKSKAHRYPRVRVKTKFGYRTL